MMSTEIIILAGGLGTRIKPVLGNTPKCLAPIGEQPFLRYVIHYFQSQGIQKFVFSLGHGHTEIETYLNSYKEPLDYMICKEETPLGTGGAVLNALRFTSLPLFGWPMGIHFYQHPLTPWLRFLICAGPNALLH